MKMVGLKCISVLILLSFISDEVYSKTLDRNYGQSYVHPGLINLKNNGVDAMPKIQNGFRNNRGPEYNSESLEQSKVDGVGM